MTDDELSITWSALEPALGRRRRIDKRVFEWLDAHDTPLAAEWLGLFKIAPFSTAGLVTVSTFAIATAPPLLWLVLLI